MKKKLAENALTGYVEFASIDIKEGNTLYIEPEDEEDEENDYKPRSG